MQWFDVRMWKLSPSDV